MERLRAYNQLSSDVIYPGQLLTISPPRPEGHRIRSGESLWAIAERYGLTMRNLRDWNDLDEEETEDMQSSIDDFMQNSATHYTPDELISDFDSTEKILDRFIAHLETRKEMAGQTLH